MYFYDDFYDESYQKPLPAEPLDAVHMVDGCYPMGYSPIQQINNMQMGYGAYGVVPAYYPQAVQNSACAANMPYNPNGDGCCSSGLSPTQQAVAASIMKHRMESESIDHKANRKDANDILRSGLKRQEMREKSDIDKDIILFREDLRLKKENDGIVIVKNPEREGRLCLQYQNASGKTIVGKPICEAKNICMNRLESYADNDTHIAYRFLIDGKVTFYIIEDEFNPEIIAQRLEEKGYPISYKRNRKAETLTAVFNSLKQECDNYPAEAIPYTEGWNYYTRNGVEHFEFVVPGSQPVFKQLAEGGDLI